MAGQDCRRKQSRPLVICKKRRVRGRSDIWHLGLCDSLPLTNLARPTGRWLHKKCRPSRSCNPVDDCVRYTTWTDLSLVIHTGLIATRAAIKPCEHDTADAAQL